MKLGTITINAEVVRDETFNLDVDTDYVEKLYKYFSMNYCRQDGKEITLEDVELIVKHILSNKRKYGNEVRKRCSADLIRIPLTHNHISYNYSLDMICMIAAIEKQMRDDCWQDENYTSEPLYINKLCMNSYETDSVLIEEEK